MSSLRNDGGPAFPRQHTVADANDHAFKQGVPGMSLRDYFAAAALTGYVANPGCNSWVEPKIAAACYILADAMISQRGEQS